MPLVIAIVPKKVVWPQPPSQSPWFEISPNSFKQSNKSHFTAVPFFPTNQLALNQKNTNIKFKEFWEPI